MARRLLLLTLAVALAVAGLSSTPLAAIAGSREARNARVVINGMEAGSNIQVVVEDGVPLMSLASLSEVLGVKLDYDPATATVSVSADARAVAWGGKPGIPGESSQPPPEDDWPPPPTADRQAYDLAEANATVMAGIKLEGPPDFQRVARQALKLLHQHDFTLYRLVRESVKTIRLAKLEEMDERRVAEIDLTERICRINHNNNRRTNPYALAGTLVHEAVHVALWERRASWRYDHNLAEKSCFEHQLQALKSVGAPESEIKPIKYILETGWYKR